MMFKAIVIGGTGATGRQLMRKLVKNENCQLITSIGRRPVLDGIKDDKIVDVVVDSMHDLSSTQEFWQNNDVFFNCIGTTRQKAGGAKGFVDIELGISQAAARMASNAQIPHASLISASGANHESWSRDWLHPLLYRKTIGQKEQTIISDFTFKMVTIFRPGMLIRLMGKRAWYDGMMDRSGIGIKVDVLALAMMGDAEISKKEGNRESSRYFIGNSEIKVVAESYM